MQYYLPDTIPDILSCFQWKRTRDPDPSVGSIFESLAYCHRIRGAVNAARLKTAQQTAQRNHRCKNSTGPSDGPVPSLYIRPGRTV
jgi:hypothetical protein